MNYLQRIDPWQKPKSTAAQSYRVEGSLFTVPFVLDSSTSKTSELTSIKSNDEFFEQFRQLPEDFFGIFDEKRAESLELNPPVKLTNMDMEMYFRESSSQHMSTLLDGVEAAGLKLANADILVTSEALNRISGTVFQQQNSWRLRASIEYVYGKNIIVICDDDSEEEAPPTPSIQFFKERLDALVLAQSICERNKTSKLLHGAHAVESTISDGDEKIRMVVLGEVDLIVERQPVNTFVSTGIGRSNRVALGSNHNVLNTCYEYLWSRSFWLGISNSLFGMRAADDGDVQFIQRFSLTDFFRQHRHRNNKIADVATNCVARVLINLKKAILSNPRENWILEYKGRAEDVEPGFVTIQKASESWSFLLIREKFHMMKNGLRELKEQDAPAPPEMPFPPTRKVLIYSRSPSFFSDEPIVVLSPSGKYRKEKLMKKSSTNRINEPPMMIMIKIEQRMLKNQSIYIDIQEVNNNEPEAAEFPMFPAQFPRGFYSIPSYSERVSKIKEFQLSKDVEVEYTPFSPSISKNQKVKIGEMHELSKDEDVEYIPFVASAPEDIGIQMNGEGVTRWIQNQKQKLRKILEEKNVISILSKSEDIETVPLSSTISKKVPKREVFLHFSLDSLKIQITSQRETTFSTDLEKKNVLLILTKSEDIEAVSLSSCISKKKVSKRKRSPSVCGPDIPPKKREKHKKRSKRSHSEKRDRHEKEDRKRVKMERESEKSTPPKHRRIESPFLEFQKHQRPLLKHSFSSPSTSGRSEKYKDNEYERNSLRYRQPPHRESYISRRDESMQRIPVHVRTVTVDSRSPTVYHRRHSRRDY